MNQFPAIHNAMWPGLVGKGPDSEPAIELDRMLDLTAAAEVDGARFDGVDLFLSLPHTSIDSTDDELKVLAEKLTSRGLQAGSLVAPVWPPTGGGSAMGNEEERRLFLTQVRKACAIGGKLRGMGVRPVGVIRIDSAASPAVWAKDPKAGTAAIAATFREAGAIALSFGEKLAAEGEICWAGMNSWRRNLELLEQVGMPGVVGFQADMAHTMLFVDWQDRLVESYQEMASALRPWTLDFHVAQNDGTVKGAGTHEQTGRHCLPLDPAGKMDIVREAGAWMRDDAGAVTRSFSHICWDGCMFSNAVMEEQQTWNDVLRTMLAVREAHGWAA